MRGVEGGVRSSLSISRNKKLILKGSNSEVIAAIEQGRDAEEIFIKRKVSNKLLYLILEFTKVKRIIMSRAVALQLPKNSLEALRKAGVVVKINERTKLGRKRKYDMKRMKRLLKRKNLKRISEREHIPLRTLYYYRKRVSERARM